MDQKYQEIKVASEDKDEIYKHMVTIKKEEITKTQK